MSDIGPKDIQGVVDSTAGVWVALVAGLTGMLSMIGGFVFKDQNCRLKAIEVCNVDIRDSLSHMATRDDVNNIHKKIDALTSENTARIIDILRDSKQ